MYLKCKKTVYLDGNSNICFTEGKRYEVYDGIFGEILTTDDTKDEHSIGNDIEDEWLNEHFDVFISTTPIIALSEKHVYAIKILTDKLNEYLFQLNLYQDLLRECRKWIEKSQWVEFYTIRVEENSKKVDEYTSKCKQLSVSIEALKKEGI